MRTEKVIIDNVLTFVKTCEDVRAVIRTDIVPVREYLWTYNFY